MSESMVERVARVIWALNDETDCNEYDELTQEAKQKADSWARAAIEAMREPTAPMVAAAEHNGTYLDWQAMIDEALK